MNIKKNTITNLWIFYLMTRKEELNLKCVRVNEILTGDISVSYTLMDSIDTITYGNGVVTGYTYDNRNRPVNIETVDGVTSLLNLSYTYDLTGSVTSINNGSFTEYYTYDLLDRLNSTVGPWGIIDYSYDPVGNRLSKSVQGGSTVTYTYDCMDRIIFASGLGFDWNANGNMVYKHDGVTAWNYTYDPLNRLTRVEKHI